MRAASHHSDEPQSGQKQNVTSNPLAEGRVNDMNVPWVRSTSSRGKKAATLNSDPVRRWQSRQWHIETFDGSPTQRRFS